MTITATPQPQRPVTITPLRFTETVQQHRAVTMSAMGCTATDRSSGWPSHGIPTEIFQLIADSLSRQDVENLRLVCREFDAKIAPLLFRSVVIPFLPDLFCLRAETRSPDRWEKDGATKSCEQMEKGLVLFKDDLLDPPARNNVEERLAFWGEYQWPYDFYHRYSLSAGMEKTSEASRTMAAAFAHLPQVTELALSVNGGLGWLNGADVSERTVVCKEKPRVLGRTRQVSSERETSKQNFLARDQDRRARGLTSLSDDVNLDEEEEDESAIDDSHLIVSPFGILQPPPAPMEDEGAVLGAEPISQAEMEAQVSASAAAGVRNLETKVERMARLIPARLTKEQQAWLVETEWVQRAYLTSYAVAVVRSLPTFHGVTSLRIARLASHQVPLLCRHDFWSALPSLATVHLAVSPTWREISADEKLDESDTATMEPSKAVPLVYRLLREFIAPLTSVKRLRFGWLDGGERAPGLMVRNQYILAAPIVHASYDLLEMTDGTPLLPLPHVEHLILDNCWVTPRAFVRFVKALQAHQLRTLGLISVSLTACPTQSPLAETNAAPEEEPAHPIFTPLQILINPHLDPTINPYLAAEMALEEDDPDEDEGTAEAEAEALFDDESYDWTVSPRHGCWVECIDQLSPGMTLSDCRAEAGLGPSKKPRYNGSLERVDFVSCGYAHLQLRWNQEAIDAPIQPRLTLQLERRRHGLAPQLMNSNDPMLAIIVPHIEAEEFMTLSLAWNLDEGWPEDENEQAAVEDGRPPGGTGRFQGSITSPRSTLPVPIPSFDLGVNWM
ncbi:MAG: hypothetical protein M1838_004985 [Thelocarpon superellum]|nr:MAG: hypothetical protein M1838_004985 [Thelocarpon superellum]